MKWNKGTPSTYDRGTIWVLLHDQSGYPFVEIAYLYGEFKSDGQFDPFNPPEIEPWIVIPALKVRKRLKNVWNIDAFLMVNKPEVPKEDAFN